MSKKLVTVREEKKSKYFNILGEQCGSESAAEWSSKHYLMRQALRGVNVVMNEETRGFIAGVILELERNGDVLVDWDKMDR